MIKVKNIHVINFSIHMKWYKKLEKVRENQGNLKRRMNSNLHVKLYFSVEEAGRYLETYKVYENKPPEALMEKTDTDYVSKVCNQPWFCMPVTCAC